MLPFVFGDLRNIQPHFLVEHVGDCSGTNAKKWIVFLFRGVRLMRTNAIVSIPNFFSSTIVANFLIIPVAETLEKLLVDTQLNKIYIVKKNIRSV